MSLLSHEFEDMPGQLVEFEAKPDERITLLRCKWCMKTPSKAREDGCAGRELAEKGSILLSEFNPAGVTYFTGRSCLTCERPIMGHWLRKGSSQYWCYDNQNQFSEGVTDCQYDVKDIAVPQEAK